MVAPRKDRRRLTAGVALVVVVMLGLVVFAADHSILGLLGRSLGFGRPLALLESEARTRLPESGAVEQATRRETESGPSQTTSNAEERPAGARADAVSAEIASVQADEQSTSGERVRGRRDNRGHGVDDEKNKESQQWSAEMEERVWAALPRIATTFTTIDSVKCTRPTCEIRYTSPDLSAVEIMPRLTLALGTDDNGMPIAKTMGFTNREVYPGRPVIVVTFSTESELH